MKKYIIIPVSVVLAFLAGCEKVIYKTTYEINIPSDIQVKEKHLQFNDSEQLATLLDSISAASRKQQVNPDLGLDNFVSVKQRKLQCSAATKAETTYEEEELLYTLSKVDELVPADELLWVLDTNLIIGVGDYVYKITKAGTFRFPSEFNEQMIDSWLESFDKSSVPKGKWETTEFEQGVCLINSYGHGYEPELIEEQDTKAANAYPSAAYMHSPYNVSSYFWGWNWIGNDLFGIDQSKEKLFDSNHKVVFRFWNVNLGFMSTSGISVKALMRKKFLFVEYWSEIPASEIQDVIIGINYLDFWHKVWINGPKIALLSPESMKGFKSVDFKTSSDTYTYITGYASTVPFITDFADSYLSTIPYIKMDGKLPDKSSRTRCQAVYSMTTKELYEIIEKTRKYHGRQNDYPCEIFAPAATGSEEFTSCRTLLSGLKHYNGNAKTITLVSYANISLLPISLNAGAKMFQNGSINSSQGIDIFGAVKWNNNYRGIRFYGKETEINSFSVY